MELLIGYFKNIPIKNWRRGVSSVICTQRGVVAREHVRTMEEGVRFLQFWCVRTNWMTLVKYFPFCVLIFGKVF